MDSSDMDFSDFASYLFLQNAEGKVLEINLHGIQNSKELFCFSLDMLCKGLVLLYGNDNKVSLKELSIDNFYTVSKKLKAIGIECHLDLVEVETPTDNLVDLWSQNFLNMQMVNDMPDDLPLDAYTFELQTASHIYKITFSTTHNTTTRCHY